MGINILSTQFVGHWILGWIFKCLHVSHELWMFPESICRSNTFTHFEKKIKYPGVLFGYIIHLFYKKWEFLKYYKWWCKYTSLQICTMYYFMLQKCRKIYIYIMYNFRSNEQFSGPYGSYGPYGDGVYLLGFQRPSSGSVIAIRAQQYSAMHLFSWLWFITGLPWWLSK